MTIRIGTDVIGVGVGAMVFNENGAVFLAQRGPQAKNERGSWEFPGGGVDFGETLEDGLKRELHEEYGIEIEIDALLRLADHILPDEGRHWVSPTYIARHVNGTAQILEPGKCSAIGWFALDSLPSPLSVISEADLAAYRARQS